MQFLLGTEKENKVKTPEELAEEYVLSQHDVNVEYSGTLEGCKDDFLAGYKAASPQWISVKDRLPEEDQEVLIGWFQVTASNKQYFAHDVAIFNENEFSGWRKYPEVTHWMPLPNPPRKE
jgi:Protein of unknown function (DUF551)